MRTYLLVIAMMLCLCGSAVAQDFPRWELFGGVQHVAGTLGGVASVAINPARWLGIVLEGSGSAAELLGNPSFNSREVSFLAGPQVSYRTGLITPFARVLAGASALHYTTSMEWQGGQESGSRTTTYSLTRLKLAIGGGVDVGNEHIAGRFAVDWMPIKSDMQWTHGARVSGGIVVRF
jgi:hypothetical protein